MKSRIDFEDLFAVFALPASLEQRSPSSSSMRLMNMLENENARPAALSLLYTVPQMTPTEPDDRILFDALIEAGASEKAAFDAVQEVRKIAAQNIVAALEANKAALECHQAVISSKIETLNSKIDSRNSQIDKTSCDERGSTETQSLVAPHGGSRGRKFCG